MVQRPSTKDVLINLVAFQCAWLALALGAAHGRSGIGIVVALLVIALHLYRSPDARAESKLLFAALIMGLVVESALMSGGVIVFDDERPVDGLQAHLAPAWLVTLWPAFSTLLNVTFRPFRAWVVFAIVLGAAGVPVAYYAGEILGALSLPGPALHGLATIGLAWAIALPVLFGLARRFDGWKHA